MAKEKYNIQWSVRNIGPHKNLNQTIDAADDKAVRIGVYATNGSGKTTLSRQFRLLNYEDDTLPSSDKFVSLDQDNGNFKFKFFKQEIGSSTQNHEFEIKHIRGQRPVITDYSKLLFHTFNSDYVKDNIEKVNYGQEGEIQGYIVGHEKVDVENEKERLEEYKKNKYKTEEKIKIEIDNAKDKLKNEGVNANTKEYKEFNLLKFLDPEHEPKEDSSYASLKKDYQKLKGIPDDLPKIKHHSSLIINNEFIEELKSKLSKKITLSNLSESFKEKVLGKERFIRLGVGELQKTGDNCPFCEQGLATKQFKLIEKYNQFIEDKETKFRLEMEDYLERVSNLKKEIKSEIDKFHQIANQYNRKKDYFPSLKKSSLKQIESQDLEKISFNKIQSLIEEKKSDIKKDIKDVDIVVIHRFKKQVKEIISKIEQNKKSNSMKIEGINQLIDDNNNELLKLKRRICLASFKELRNEYRSEIEDINSDVIKISDLEVIIREKEEEINKSKKEVVGETFSELLSFVFNEKYVFDYKKDLLKFKDFSLQKNAEDVLSDGEKRIIAFCYYIAEAHILIEKEIEYNKLFFIIDDPVSSMDFHYTYSVCRIIEKLHEFFKIKFKEIKFIILTHNLEFMSILLRNNIIRKKYVLTPGKLNKLNKELVMPYHGHLSDLYKITMGKGVPDHTTPNSMRHVLETLARFENPSQKVEEFMENTEGLEQLRALPKLVHDLSHGIFRNQPSVSDDLIIEGCKGIINYIKENYSGQISVVKKSI